MTRYPSPRCLPSERLVNIGAGGMPGSSGIARRTRGKMIPPPHCSPSRSPSDPRASARPSGSEGSALPAGAPSPTPRPLVAFSLRSPLPPFEARGGNASHATRGAQSPGARVPPSLPDRGDPVARGAKAVRKALARPALPPLLGVARPYEPLSPPELGLPRSASLAPSPSPPRAP
jgi:hypothetical protein